MNTASKAFKCLYLGLAAGLCVDAYAHTFRNRFSVYNDNQGVTRERFKTDLSLDLAHEKSVITNSTYGIAASQERYGKDDITEDEYMREVYGSGRRTTDSVLLSAAQTWNKVTDSRVFANYTTDGVMDSRSGGLGLSQWFWRENLQLSVDVSRTIVKQPVFEVLGADSDVISPPPMINSTGTMIAAKYLATPTTISTLGYTHVEKNDRPPANIYSFGVKQFVPKTKSAIHFDGARGFNQGRVTNKTTYGEVNAWIGEIAFLQSLWTGANSKVAYRYYKEDETTRVENDQYVRGSDLVSFFLSQAILQGTIEGSVSRYKTNEIEEGTKLTAYIYELGVLAKF